MGPHLLCGAVPDGVEPGNGHAGPISQALRGKDAPQNVCFYLTMFTLAVMLLFRLPPLWKAVGGFRRVGPRDFTTPAGLAPFTGGLVALTIPRWASPTHIGPNSANWVSVLRTPLLVGGAAVAVLGVVLVGWNSRKLMDPAAMPREGRPVARR